MNLKITVIQSELHWKNVDANLLMFEQKIGSIKEQTDIIVLPEMFATGFTMESKENAETMNGKSVNWMKKIAEQKKVVLIGSLIIEEEQKYYNRLFWVQPDGQIQTYNKRHLFRMAGENQFYSSGNERLIVEWKGWKICPLICYDLRFPVWSRNNQLKENKLDQKLKSQSSEPFYDCLIYVANWPEARKEPWSILLKARAIENQAFVVGVNRVGLDGNQINYSGNSAILNPKGEEITSILPGLNQIETIELNRQELEDFRIKFPVGLDADSFTIH